MVLSVAKTVDVCVGQDIVVEWRKGVEYVVTRKNALEGTVVGYAALLDALDAPSI